MRTSANLFGLLVLFAAVGLALGLFHRSTALPDLTTMTSLPKAPRHHARVRSSTQPAARTRQVQNNDIAVANEKGGARLQVFGHAFPFPEDQMIRSGMSEAAIVAAFGHPNTRITSLDLGQLRRIYLYVDEATDRMTIIRLAHDSVTQAETVAR